MKKYLLDASVIVKSLLGENDHVEKEFKKITNEVSEGKASLISSDFLNTEVLNGFRYGLNTQAECKIFFEKFVELPIKKYSLTKVQYLETILLSYKNNTTIYDTSYHVLAKAYGGIFLTCDKQYYNRAKKLEYIRLLD